MKDSIKFDENGIPIQPKKLKECQLQISKNDYAITQLEKTNRDFKLDKYHDSNAPEIQQKIKDNEQQIRKLEKNNDIRKRCHALNYGYFEEACSKCEVLPKRVEDVISYDPKEIAQAAAREKNTKPR